MKHILDFFLSLRTSLWLLTFLVLFLLAGTFIMPSAQEFRTIHDLPLFEWIAEQPPGVTWWLWAAIALLFLLVVNTISCSIESLIKKSKARHWLFIIAPQVIHLGFLFILLAHFFSAMSGFKSTAPAREGSYLDMPGGTSVLIRNISVAVTQDGYIDNWAVWVEYISDGKKIEEAELLPNKPSFFKGVGVYVRDIRAYPERAVLIEVSREPGAVWALMGGLFFMVGTVTLLAFKMKSEG